MSQFIDQTKIAVLEETVSNLRTENSNLEAEVNNLKHEVTRLGENPDYIRHIRDKLDEYEKREQELRARISLILEETASHEKRREAVRKLLELFEKGAADTVEEFMDHYHRKKEKRNMVIAFVLGVLASLTAWGITSYVDIW